MGVEAYKQSIPYIGLSLERATSNIPRDGYFYVLLRGEIKGKFRSLKRAQLVYKALLQESGYKPPTTDVKVDPAQETVDRYFDRLEAYWSNSHKYTRRGGKTMYRS